MKIFLASNAINNSDGTLNKKKEATATAKQTTVLLCSEEMGKNYDRNFFSRG